MFDLNKLIRPNIKTLKAYSSARDEFSGEAKVFLDANENSLGSPLLKWYNRYPDPHQHAVKATLSKVKGIKPEHIFLGNGSDECIDLLFLLLNIRYHFVYYPVLFRLLGRHEVIPVSVFFYLV